MVLNEDGGRGISYEGPRTYAADAHEVEAAEEDTDTCVLMGKQRMRLGMSGSAFSASHTSANAAGSVRTSLFMDQDDETDILHGWFSCFVSVCFPSLPFVSLVDLLGQK